MEKLKEHSWIISVLLTLMALLSIMIIKGIYPFGGYSFANHDCIQQYIPFLSEYRNKLVNGESLFFSWDISLGTDFFTVFTYYLSSPLNLLVVFFNKNDLNSFISLVVVLRIVISAGTMTFFLSRKHIGEMKEVENKGMLNIAAVSFGIAYALSAYALGYYWNIMWFDCIAVFPLVMLGLDKLISEHKPVLYILSLAYCMYANYYIAFIICISLVLYFFTYSFKSIIDFFKSVLVFGLCSIVSVGLSFLTLFTTICSLNGTIASEDSLGSVYWFGNIFKIIRNVFIFSKPVTMSQVQSEVNVYAGVGIIVLLCFLPLCKGLRLNEKISRIIIIVLLFASMNNSLLNYVWHGLHHQAGIPNRFSFVYIFIAIETAFIIFEHIFELSFRRFVSGIIVALILPMVVYFFTDYNGLYSSKTILILSLIIICVYSLVIALCSMGKKLSKVMSAVFSILLMAEIFINAIASFNNGDMYYAADVMNEVGKVEKINIDTVSEKDFYREEVTQRNIYNENIYHNMHGVGVFSSALKMDHVLSMYALGLQTGYPYYYYSGLSPFMDDILGVKYIHSSEIEYYWDDNYSQVDSGVVPVYENKNALPVGYGMSKEVLFLDIFSNDVNAADKQEQMAYISTGMSGMFENVDRDVTVKCDCADVSYDNGIINISNVPQEYYNQLIGIQCEFDIDQDGNYYFQIVNNLIEGVMWLVNDVESPFQSGSSRFLSMGDLKKGDKVEILFFISGSTADGNSIPLLLSKYDKTVEENVINTLSKNSLDLTEYDSDSLHGTFALDDNSMLFLSIPYDEGWEMHIDGLEAAYFPAVGNFIGIDAGEGNHTIYMKYVPKGFTIGCLVSAVSWICFICVLLYIKFRKKNKEREEIEETEE